MLDKGKKEKVDPIVARFNRIEGQVAGIRRMYEKDACDCEAIVQQIQAARSALGKVAGLVLTDEAGRCVEENDIKRFKKIVDDTFKVL